MTETEGLSSASASHQEVEWKLTARDARLLDDLADRVELAGYRLESAPPRQIRDQYWDTPDRTLAACHWGLRTRIEDGVAKLTIKRTESRRAGLFRREELELPATPDNWAQILARLVRGGAQLSGGPVPGGDPADWLTAAGLRIVQDRSTHRRVLIAYQNDCPVAELALDLSTYYLGAYEVLFREIEVEALTAESRHVRALGRALERTYEGRVSPSKHGKYSLGLKLATSLARLQP
jgi:inorganic triphosphatase YgiF